MPYTTKGQTYQERGVPKCYMSQYKPTAEAQRKEKSVLHICVRRQEGGRSYKNRLNRLILHDYSLSMINPPRTVPQRQSSSVASLCKLGKILTTKALPGSPALAVLF